MGVVTIHVFDAASAQQSATRDYTCEVKLLLKHMCYFKPFLQGVPGENLEISVQCNLHTFEWLMAYVKSRITGIHPVLDSSNCIPILIACNYLKMAQLVREVVTFIAANILQLAATGADIAALDGALLTKVAKATKEEALEQLLQQCQQVQLPQLPTRTAAAAEGSAGPDPQISNDKFKSSGHVLLQKLYKHKLEALLKDHNTTLLRCSACQQLFSASSHKKLQCPALVGQATERLKVLPLHQPDSTWRFQDFLQQQRQPTKQQAQPQVPLLHTQPRMLLLQQQQQQQSVGPTPWRDLYWLTWGHVTVLYCQQCHQHFPARQLRHCSSHPLAPVFGSEVDAGVYPCCGRPAWRPGLPLAYSQGCCAGHHQTAVQRQHKQQQQLEKQAKATQQQEQMQQQADAAQCDAATRALQLLECFGQIILEPYKQPPLPPYETAQLPSLAGPFQAAAEAAVNHAAGSRAGGADGSSSSRCGSQGASSRHAARGGESLPLLVRMTNRASKTSTPRMLSSLGGAGTWGSNTPLINGSPCSGCSSLVVVAEGPMTHAISAAAAAEAAATAARPGSGASSSHANMAHTGNVLSAVTAEDDAGSSSSCCSSDEQDYSEEDAMNEFDGELDYRSAHLRSFMDAVRAAAQSHNRSSGLLGLGGISVGRLQAEVGVPLGNTFSSAGAARHFGRRSMLSQSSSQQQQQQQHLTYRSNHALVRPGGRQYGQVVPTSTGSTTASSNSRAAGRLSSKAAVQNATRRPLSTGTAAAVAPDVQAHRVNRTLLLELMHEDDVYRMGLLMRKLDAVRLQPRPDEAETTAASRSSSSSRTSQLMSGEQVTHTVNSTLFQGMPSGCQQHSKSAGYNK